MVLQVVLQQSVTECESQPDHNCVCCWCRASTPTMLDYKIHADNDSMYNTPPCWSMYICGLVFEKLLKQGEHSMWQPNGWADINHMAHASHGCLSSGLQCVGSLGWGGCF